MTPEKYAEQYLTAPNYQAIAKQSFKDGLRQGRDENKSTTVRKMEKELKTLREYKKFHEDLFSNPEKLGEYICGL